ncbi:hypothetical protein OF830_07210 [Bacillus paramycoides]|uniref:hypothetical protein n=1 Tax=Bacillus paramycoides TaxID=2026194 RepID=UPI002242FF15|nr:hypothetical protein [Bacillus paramycoides]MCW9130752.1 hypothetical protein [Bacillus paramycoides]
MLKETIKTLNIECIGGFTAKCADPIIAHINPSELSKRDIFVIIKNDNTIWATKAIQENIDSNNIKWLEITKNNIKQRKSFLARKTCYFEVTKGDLFGVYLISEDLILNNQFVNAQSYIKFISV